MTINNMDYAINSTLGCSKMQTYEYFGYDFFCFFGNTIDNDPGFVSIIVVATKGEIALLESFCSLRQEYRIIYHK